MFRGGHDVDLERHVARGPRSPAPAMMATVFGLSAGGFPVAIGHGCAFSTRSCTWGWRS